MFSNCNWFTLNQVTNTFCSWILVRTLMDDMPSRFRPFDLHISEQQQFEFSLGNERLSEFSLRGSDERRQGLEVVSLQEKRMTQQFFGGSAKLSLNLEFKKIKKFWCVYFPIWLSLFIFFNIIPNFDYIPSSIWGQKGFDSTTLSAVNPLP